MAEVNNMVKLSEYCKTHGIDAKHARRLARKGLFPGAEQILGLWAIAKDAPVPELPEKGTRATSREDGRVRWIVMATPEEAESFVKMGCDVIDPRARAKARRDARKAESE